MALRIELIQDLIEIFAKFLAGFTPNGIFDSRNGVRIIYSSDAN
jgi:hypothetical protein